MEKILLRQSSLRSRFGGVGGYGGKSGVVQAATASRQRAFTRCIQHLPTWSIMHHKRLMIDDIYEHDGLWSNAADKAATTEDLRRPHIS